MQFKILLYFGLILNVFQCLLAGALLGGHLKNVDLNENPLLDNGTDDEKQNDFERSSYFVPTSNDHRTTYTDNEINKNPFSNHRDSYGPLHQSKTYKYPYPLISSSYASMKIQGVNKYKIISGKDRVITTHRFPSSDNNIVNFIPNYNSNIVTSTTSVPTITRTTTTTTTTTPAPTSRLPITASSSSLPPKINITTPSSTSVITTTTSSSTRVSSKITTVTSTTPRTTTIKLKSTTESREEADNLFNKFLMEIFKTTDFDNIDHYKNEDKQDNKDLSSSSEPPEENLNYDERLYSDVASKNEFDDPNVAPEKLELTVIPPTLNISHHTYDGYQINPNANMSTTNYSDNEKFVYVEYDENDLPINQSNSYVLDYYTDADYTKPNNVQLTNLTTYDNEKSHFYSQMDGEDDIHKKINIAVLADKLMIDKINITEHSTTTTSTTTTTEVPKNPKVTTESNILIQLLNMDKSTTSTKAVPLVMTKTNKIETKSTPEIVTSTLRIPTTTTTNSSNNENYMISVSLLPPIDRTNEYQYLQELKPPLPQQDLSKHVYYHVEKLSSTNERPPSNQSPSRNPPVDTFKVPPLPADARNNTEISFKPLENVYLMHDGETNDKKKVVHGSATLSVGIPVISPAIVENQTTNYTKIVSKLIMTNNTLKLPEYNRNIQTNDKILPLNSQPMYHQLPTDLTPPLEDPKKLIRTHTYTRPSWELKPAHFHSNERVVDYSVPLNKLKRIPDTNLPNILPQFRPNAKISHHHPPDTIGTIHNKHLKRPLSPPLPPPPLQSPHHNTYVRPINNYYEKLQPPPHRIQQLPILNHSGHRKTINNNNDLERRVYDKEPPLENTVKRVWGVPQEFSHGPPKLPERYVPKNGNGSENEVSTLQMIKSMQNTNVNAITVKNSSNKIDVEKKNENEDFPLYVVYPTNHSSLSLNIFNTDKSTVVVGKRGEQPIPPSEIHDPDEKKATVYAQSVGHYPNHPILSTDYPLLTDFPYPIERPNITILNTGIKYVTPDKHSSSLDQKPPTKTNEIQYEKYYPASTSVIPAAAINSGVVVGIGKDVPAKEHIAIAYTPTESPTIAGHVYPAPSPADHYVKIDMAPHYSTGVVEHNKNEFTVSAIMHTHPQHPPPSLPQQMKMKEKLHQKLNYYQNELLNQNHRIDYDAIDRTHPPVNLDFQAPFQASISIDSPQEQWSIVRNKADESDAANTTNDELSSTRLYDIEASTTAANKDFDFENFKPQLFGGFKPIIKVTTENDTMLEI